MWALLIIMKHEVNAIVEPKFMWSLDYKRVFFHFLSIFFKLTVIKKILPFFSKVTTIM